MAKRYTKHQLSQYPDEFLWCRSFGHAWEFVEDEVGKGTVYEIVECVHCGMLRHDWREGEELVDRQYDVPDGYYIKGQAGRSAHETFQGERIARKRRRRMKVA